MALRRLIAAPAPERVSLEEMRAFLSEPDCPHGLYNRRRLCDPALKLESLPVAIVQAAASARGYHGWQ
jgi:hypothetical protein